MKKKSYIIIVSIIVVALLLVDYGWRLFGFNACSAPSVPSVDEINVTEDRVLLTGTTFDSATHYIGYIKEIEGNTLYIGMRYQLITIFHSGGSFNIEIPLDGEKIDRIYINNNDSDELIWKKHQS